MRKKLTYIIFALASAGVVAVFVTAKSYIQLGIAILLYPVLAFFALKVFQHKSWKAPVVVVRVPARSTAKPRAEAVSLKREQVEVTDVDKRTFLKLIGAAGLSFFIFSLLGRRVDALLFGGSAGPAASALATAPSGQAGPTVSPATAGYSIAEIDDGVITYYGFTNKDSAWLIMREDTQTNSFRYAKGNSLFPTNWANRANLRYDYYSNLF